MQILGWIIFGALTGWIASKIVNRRGEGCMVNTALGLVGAVVGGFLFQRTFPLGYPGSYPGAFRHHGFLVSMFVAVIGAIIVLVLWNALTGKRTLR